MFDENETKEIYNKINNYNLKVAIFSFDKFITDPELHVEKEDIAIVNIGIIYQKNSFLQPLFDKTIYQIIEIGLISKWSKVFDLAESTAVSHDLQLKLKHFHGCLFICSILYMLAVIVFLGELYWAKRRN